MATMLDRAQLQALARLHHAVQDEADDDCLAIIDAACAVLAVFRSVDLAIASGVTVGDRWTR